MNNKNELFNLFGTPTNKTPNQQPIQNEENFNNMFKSMDDFTNGLIKFKNSLNERPEDKLQRLLDTGEMSQSQYNMLYSLGKKIQKAL